MPISPDWESRRRGSLEWLKSINQIKIEYDNDRYLSEWLGIKPKSDWMCGIDFGK